MNRLRNDFSANRREVLAFGAAAGLASALPFSTARAAVPAAKVGVILPTSGIFAADGQDALRGVQFGEKLVKERGEVELTVVTFDSQSKPENGRVAVENLVGQGCNVIIGAYDSGATISAAQACEAAKVPLVINIASAPQITEQGFTQIFRNFPTSAQLVTNAVAGIKQMVLNSKPEMTSAVVLYSNDTAGTAVLKAIDNLWGDLAQHIKILDRIGYDAKSSDLSVEVAKAKATDADLLLPITRVNDAILIVRELVKQNWSPKAVIGPSSPGPYSKTFTDTLGKYADDYMCSIPWYDPKKPAAAAVVNRFSREFPDRRFELNVGFSYEALIVVADAVKRAASAEPAAIQAALKTTNIVDHVMAGGPIQFDAKGQNNNIASALLQDRGGKPLVVLPKEMAEGELHFPLTPYDQR
jgi:branched-chain amino acid transport system substrate-binding protein